jgi:hypothetical protein
MKHWVPKLNVGIDLTRLALARDELALLGRIDGRMSNFDLAILTGASLDHIQQLLFRLFVEGIVGRADGNSGTGDLAQLFIEQGVPVRHERSLLDNDAVVTALAKPAPASDAPAVASSGFEPVDTARTLPLMHSPVPGTPLRGAGVDEIEIEIEIDSGFESNAPTVKRTLVPPPTTTVQPADPALLAACTDWGAAFAHTMPREFSATATTLGDQKSGLELPVISSADTVVELSDVVESAVTTAPAGPARPTPLNAAAFAPTAPALNTAPAIETAPATVIDGEFSPMPTTKIAPKPGAANSVDPVPVTAPAAKPDE